MDSVRIEDLIFGIPLAVAAVVLLVIAIASVVQRDREAIMISAGVGVMFGFLSLMLCTGWVNILPLPK
jgi:hypothetical protein